MARFESSPFYKYIDWWRDANSTGATAIQAAAGPAHNNASHKVVPWQAVTRHAAMASTATGTSTGTSTDTGNASNAASHR